MRSREDPMEKSRGQDRYSYERPDVVYVRFKLDKAGEKDEVRLLNVIDSSKTGLAMLITQKDADLLDILRQGDRIKDMSFFGLGAKIKEDGIVRHMTKLEAGKYKGSYVVGVEAPDIGTSPSHP
jgi:hypothetical protein